MSAGWLGPGSWPDAVLQTEALHRVQGASPAGCGAEPREAKLGFLHYNFVSRMWVGLGTLGDWDLVFL